MSVDTNEATIYAAIVAGVVSTAATVTTYFRSKKEAQYTEASSLSHSEASFREDLMQEVDKMRDLLKDCERRHNECQRSYNLLDARVRHLEAELGK